MMDSFNTSAENTYTSPAVCSCSASPESYVNLIQSWLAFAASDERPPIVDTENFHFNLSVKKCEE